MGSGPTQRTRSETLLLSHNPTHRYLVLYLRSPSYYLRRASILKVLWLWLRLQDAGALGHFTARRITPPSGEVCTAEISLVVEDAAFRGHRDAWEVSAPSRCLASALCLLVPLALAAFCFLSTPSRGRI